MSGKNSRNVTTDPATLLVGNEGAIRVPVGRHDRIDIVLLSPLRGESHVLGTDRFGVDRHELVRIPHANDVRAQLFQQAGQEVPAHA